MKRRSIRPVSSKKRASPAEKRIVERVLSMQTTMAFKSQLESEYRHGNLSKTVLSRLFSRVNKSGFSPPKKTAVLKALTDYRQRV